MDFYFSDKIPALQAKFEAQKICFSPLTFQAVRTMLELGILRAVSDAGTQGISREEIVARTGVSVYGAGVLAEIGLGMGVLKILPKKDGDSERLVLGKIGWFFLEDAMTAVNLTFVNDVCYKGALALDESIKTGKPCGLSVFGNQWETIYQALSTLPEKTKKSWFDWDHFYSDAAFPIALPLVFASPVLAGGGHLFDIGGNTAKLAIACCKYNKDVKVTIVDLPGQTEMAQRNAQAAGFENRIDAVPCNVLDEKTVIPAGADAVWMSQFLHCFSLEEITAILRKVNAAVGKDTDIWVLEPLWDMQHYEVAAFTLQAISLYFACMASGNNKMYRFAELCAAVEKAGFELKASHHNIGSNSHSLLRFKKVP